MFGTDDAAPNDVLSLLVIDDPAGLAPPGKDETAATAVVVSLEADRIRLIGAPASVVEIVVGAGAAAIVRDSVKHGRVVEIQIGGHPWSASATGRAMVAEMILAHVPARLRNYGFVVYASLDMPHNT
ncbi:hypothetical protein H9P43_004631 [Blastocladiella emersonii ATCC 22665]|nr:hypothetical protein H9P43_004631 [Blastocladiella emersonii ATCC 22665]